MQTNTSDYPIMGWQRRYGILAVIWSVLVVGSLLWDIHQEKQSTLRTVTAAARANISKDISFRKWATSHGGVYVFPTEHTPPNPYLKVPDRDVVTTTGKALTLMNPAYMLREMQADFADDFGTKSHITSLKLINPKNAPDVWEAKALRSFEQGEKELLETQQIDGQPYLRLMLPFIVERGCLKCHEQQGYKLGEIRGGISSAIPLKLYLVRERELSTNMALSHGTIWLLGLAGLGLSYRRDRRQAGEREKAANDFRASEHRLSEAQRIAHLGSWNLDIANNALTWSDEIYRIFEIDPEKFGATYEAFLNAIHPDDRELVNNAYTESVKNKSPYNIAHRLLMKDGRVKYVNEICETSYGGDGTPLHSFGIVHDITERKRAEEELRISEERLALAARTGGIGIWDWDVVENKLVWDDAMYRLYGIRRGDFGGAYEAWASVLYPEDKAHTEAEIQAALRGEREYAPEFRVIWPDGSLHYIKAASHTLFDDKGRPLRMVGINYDLTERKLAEQELREKEERLALATIHNGVGVWDWNLITQQMIWDDSMYSLYHIRREDFIGTEEAWRAALHPDDLERGDREVNEAIAGIKPFDTVFRVVWPGGEIRHIKAVAKVFRDGQGTPLRMLGINMDITERKQMEEKINELNRDLELRVIERTAELEAANKDMESFSYSISHDLRAPLRAIDGFSRILHEEYVDRLDDEGKRLLNVVGDNAQKMGQLIDDILAFSRAGRNEIKRSAIDMRSMVTDVWEELKPDMAERNVRLDIRDIPPIEGDPAMIHQVVLNLMSNAVKFTQRRADARIEVGGQADEHETVYHVKDNGIGFDMQYAQKLFGVFQRLHGMDEFEGTGIGLAIVKRIITKHGGRVWAESKLNDGATIYFALPTKENVHE